jgi:hypothetical protein
MRRNMLQYKSIPKGMRSETTALEGNRPGRVRRYRVFIKWRRKPG